MAADTRAAAADNYAHTDVTSGNVISSSHENNEGSKIEISLNQARAMLLDLESGYSSATAPNAVEGKRWYDSGDGVLKFYSGTSWEQLNTLNTKSSVTAAAALTTSQYGNIIEYNGTVAATLTLPSVTSGEDGIINVINNSEYTVTVAPSDTFAVWNSGYGYGIDIPDRGTFVTLRSDYTNSKWDIVHKTGGRVMIEGLKLHELFDKSPSFSSVGNSTTNHKTDNSGRHSLAFEGGVAYVRGTGKFAPMWYQFDGTNGSGNIGDSADWDIFGDTIGVKTVAGWVYHDDTGGSECYVSQYENSGNRWFFYKTTANELTLRYFDDTVLVIDSGGGAMSKSTWYHCAAIIDSENDIAGIYLDGQQVAVDTAWTTSTLSGDLYVGQLGDASTYIDGRMQDLHISFNNPYNASPDTANADSFTVPAAPFEGVME